MAAQKPSVYLETTVPSYLTARPSSDPILFGHQVATRHWWETQRGVYNLFISGAVHREISAGDPVYARRRLDAVEGLEILDVTDQAIELGVIYMQHLPIPPSAEADALHIATATVHGMDYLVTWNLRHIANNSVRRKLPALNKLLRLPTPIICTPEDLLNEPGSLV